MLHIQGFLGEMADVPRMSIPRTLSIILEKLWISGDVPEDWKKANVPPSTRRAERRIQVITDLSILLYSLGKLGNKLSWGLSQVK